MKVYLAGPRTGVSDYNRPMFEAAALSLRQSDCEVITPIELDDPEDGMLDGDGTPLPPDVYARGLEKCIAAMCAGAVEAVVVLPGWENSRGACLEVHVARTLGKSIYRLVQTGPDHGFDLELIKAEPTPEAHPASERFYAIIREWAALHARKQLDYGRDDDPFANVRSSEDFGIPGWIGTAMRANDKMKRIQTAASQYLATGTVNLANEGLIDAFDDLGVYAGICRVLFEEATAPA